MPCDHEDVVAYESRKRWGGIYYLGVCLQCETTLCRQFQDYTRTQEMVNLFINGHLGHYEIWRKE